MRNNKLRLFSFLFCFSPTIKFKRLSFIIFLYCNEGDFFIVIILHKCLHYPSSTLNARPNFPEPFEKPSLGLSSISSTCFFSSSNGDIIPSYGSEIFSIIYLFIYEIETFQQFQAVKDGLLNYYIKPGRFLDLYMSIFIKQQCSSVLLKCKTDNGGL